MTAERSASSSRASELTGLDETHNVSGDMASLSRTDNPLGNDTEEVLRPKSTRSDPAILTGGSVSQPARRGIPVSVGKPRAYANASHSRMPKASVKASFIRFFHNIHLSRPSIRDQRCQREHHASVRTESINIHFLYPG